MKNIIQILFVLLTLLPNQQHVYGHGDYLKLSDQPPYPAKSIPDNTLWQYLLEQHVDNSGHVDYQGFLKDREVLESYLKILKDHQPTEQWTKNEKLSYYINLYNAYTVLLILDHYPTKSIKEIKNPWDQKLIPLHNDQISLGHLEHNILRKMGEPRIHFAINCASASCPKLLNMAYEPQKLEQQLDAVTKEFIGSERNELSKNQLRLSKIFKWYKNDFLDGDIISYIKQFTRVPISENTAIDYLDYDWSLNGN